MHTNVHTLQMGRGFGLSPLCIARIEMLHDHEEFEVETDEPGEPPLSFWSETVLGVMVE